VGGRVKRPDLCNRTIYEDWLNGESQLSLSIKYECTVNTISGRLEKARKEFPALARKVRKTPEKDPGVTEYVHMNDGKPGESVLRQGSIVRSTSLRNRNR